MRCRLPVIALSFAVSFALAQPGPLAAQTTPSVDQIVSLKRVGSPAISPDGRLVAYTVRETNWDENAYETEIWLADSSGGSPRQLTNAKGSSDAPAWSPDGRWLAFVSDRAEKRQIYLIDPEAGEAAVLTSAEDGVSGFAWSPDGRQIAYTATDPKSAALKERDKKYGEFEVVDQDLLMTHLYVIDGGSKNSRRLTDGPFTVGSFALVARRQGDRLRPSRQQRPGERRFSRHLGRLRRRRSPPEAGLAAGRRLAPRLVAGRDAHRVRDGAGEPGFVQLHQHDHRGRAGSGRRDRGSQSGVRREPVAHRLDAVRDLLLRLVADLGLPLPPRSGHAEGDAVRAWRRVDRLGLQPEPGLQTVAFVAVGRRRSPRSSSRPLETMEANEAERPRARRWPAGRSARTRSFRGRARTAPRSRACCTSRRLPGREALSPARRHPRRADRRLAAGAVRERQFYPIDVWLARGALVLEPNYRGSAGYGEKFRSLNVRNLGVGDAWDVLSGIDYLVAQGLVDNDRVGAMGWSQGGYISAFLTTHDSARFKAISVGAGISDWMTYYVNTDIHPFTRQYLKATPWDDPEIYAKTSPITYIKQAKAPTLIQHGEHDRRVPIPNAYELYQGLQDQNVPVEAHRLQGLRPRPRQAEGAPRGDGAQPRVVRQVHLEREVAGGWR